MFIPTVAVRLYRPIALALQARGVSADEVFAEFGLPSPATTGWDVRVPLPQIAGIWDRLLAVTGDRFFSLAAAEHIDLTTCDVITFLEAKARTAREALEKKFEYLALITDAIAWTLETAGDQAILTVHERPPRPPLAPVAEFLIAARHVFFDRFGPPGWRLDFVRFRHEAPSEQTDRFLRIFGVAPVFSSAEDQIGFSASLLDTPMRSRDDALSELLLRYAGKSHDHLPRAQMISSDRVRQILRSGLDPGISAVARQLGTSARTLQRNLALEGTSYLEILSHMQRAAAEHLLSRRELAVSEIAYALGFSDVPAFHHAFRRWTGSTPGEYRLRSLGSGFVEPSLGRLGRAGRRHSSA